MGAKAIKLGMGQIQDRPQYIPFIAPFRNENVCFGKLPLPFGYDLISVFVVRRLCFSFPASFLALIR